MTRRWLQFSLGSLFVLVAVAALLVVGWQRATRRPGPILRGTVYDDAGQPVSGVRLIAWTGMATWFRVGETVTDSRGQYLIDPVAGAREWDAQGVARHILRIQLVHPAFVSFEQAASGSSSFADSTVIVVVPDEDRLVYTRDFRVTRRK